MADGVHQNATSKPLTALQVRAAQMLAADELSDADIASNLGINRTTIHRWKLNAAFAAQIAAVVAETAAALKAEGIANRQNRVDALNDRWAKLQAVIAARAKALEKQAPGGETGLIVETVKLAANGDTVSEYQVDTGLLKELREHEKQAAQELQQWTERREVETKASGAITIQYVNDWRNPDA